MDHMGHMDHSGHGMVMDLPPFTLGRGLAFSAEPFFLITCLLGLGLYAWGSYDCAGAATHGPWPAPSPTSSAC